MGMAQQDPEPGSGEIKSQPSETRWLDPFCKWRTWGCANSGPLEHAQQIEEPEGTKGWGRWYLVKI